MHINLQTQKHASAFVIPCYALLLGQAIMLGPMAGLFCALFPFFVWIVLHKPRAILFFILLFLPFQLVPLLSQNIAGIPGMKISNLLAAGAFVVLLMQEGSLLRFRDPLEKKAMFVMAMYFLFFSISFFRSLENLSLFSQLVPEQFQNSRISYTLSFYIKPSLYLIAPLVILKSFRNKKDINTVLTVLMVSIFVLSCSVLIIGVSNFGELAQGRGVMKKLCVTFLGVHYNAIGTIYIVCFPIIILKAFEKHPFGIANILLAVTAIFILQSRTTLLTCTAISGILFYILKKKKLLIAVALCLGSIVIVWLPQTLLQGFTSGMEQATADSLLSGRVSHLWAPLLSEWIGNTQKLLFGAGHYGMLTSPKWASGFLVQATHAHNAFIDFFLNDGSILLLLLLFFITTSVIKAWKRCKQINSPLCWGLFLSINAYLIGAVSGRSIYPHQDNMLLLPLIAMLVNLFRLHLYEKI